MLLGPSPLEDLDTYRKHYGRNHMPNDLELYDMEIKCIREEFPDFQLVEKSRVWWMYVIGVVLRVLSLGSMSTFMSTYTTTIGRRVYTPSRWEYLSLSQKRLTLRHELVHMRQAKSYGAVRFALLYLFVPFPVYWSRWRAKFEKEAYAESMRLRAERYGAVALHAASVREPILENFLTGKYLWMCPSRIEMLAWYEGVVADLTEKQRRHP